MQGETHMASDRTEFRFDLFKVLNYMQRYTYRSDMVFSSYQSNRSAEARADDRQAEDKKVGLREHAYKMAFLK